MKLNQRGLSHHLLFPIIAVLAVGAIGAAVAKFSSAAVQYVQPETVALCRDGFTLTGGKCAIIGGSNAIIEEPTYTKSCPKGTTSKYEYSGSASARLVCIKGSTSGTKIPSLTSSTAATDTLCSRWLLHSGMKNKCVKLAQLKLQSCGTQNKGLSASGSYDGATVTAAKNCQRYLKKTKNSKIDVSGKIDTRTWTQLKKIAPASVQ